ncbi:uncharacterized protein LOC123290686 [Chrysoperla carnea]|uniref:uncharacterized protein LOC123290686 n=1 Tax=Chrysoperla carnea TaxID=189513 RepID=UPI001D085168|nr:uncharacterized protein LOC123290686 [Chrysoperla carnea]
MKENFIAVLLCLVLSCYVQGEDSVLNNDASKTNVTRQNDFFDIIKKPWLNFIQPAKTNIFSTINIFGFGTNSSTNSSTFEIPAENKVNNSLFYKVTHPWDSFIKPAISEIKIFSTKNSTNVTITQKKTASSTTVPVFAVSEPATKNYTLVTSTTPPPIK